MNFISSSPTNVTMVRFYILQPSREGCFSQRRFPKICPCCPFPMVKVRQLLLLKVKGCFSGLDKDLYNHYQHSNILTNKLFAINSLSCASIILPIKNLPRVFLACCLLIQRESETYALNILIGHQQHSVIISLLLRLIVLFDAVFISAYFRFCTCAVCFYHQSRYSFDFSYMCIEIFFY